LAHGLLALLLHLGDALHDLVRKLIRSHAMLLTNLRKRLASLKLLEKCLPIHTKDICCHGDGRAAAHHRPHFHSPARSHSFAHVLAHTVAMVLRLLLDLRAHLLAGLLQCRAHPIDRKAQISSERVEELLPQRSPLRLLLSSGTALGTGLRTCDTDDYGKQDEDRCPYSEPSKLIQDPFHRTSIIIDVIYCRWN
jgi:hypothetical protein